MAGRIGIGSTGIGELELVVMKVVWHIFGNRSHDVTVKEVFEFLYHGRRLAYTTIMTVMTRMAKKGLLNQNRAAMPYQYRPAVSQQALKKQIMAAVEKSL